MNLSKKDETSHLFFGKYKILKRIGCGSFGNVYKGVNIIDKKKVAIKVERKDKGYNLLQKESYYLYNLRGIGIPELISYGYSGNYNVLVQTLLGESLGKIFYKKNNFFPLKDICMFTIQILHRIEYVHSKYLIHRDIKPENFLIGDPDKYMIYIIDFGLSKKYKSSRTNKHIQFKLTKKFTGTARYASINAVRGAEQSRRDDLEAVGYMLMYFFNKGKLPWQGVSCKEKAHKYAKIYTMKKNLDYDVFCKDMPQEIIPYMNYCKELPFDKDPDYEYLRSLFESALKRNNFQNDLKFSWISDYSILKDSQEIKNKIRPINLSKKKQSPQSRIYKQLESAREISKEKNNDENKNDNILINNKSQVNLFNNNPIVKAKTYNIQNIVHKRFNSSWDVRGVNDPQKSSIAKYDSIIDEEEPTNNMSNINNIFFNSNNNNNNTNTLNIKNIYEKNNWNISNNGNLLNKYYSNNNLFYFSNNFNLNDLSRSLILQNNTSKDNTFTMNLKNDNISTIKSNTKIPNNLNNENNSPNIIKSFSYVKKYENKIDEIKINFNSKPINKHTRNNNANSNNLTNPINEQKVIPIMIRNNSNNIIYSKKKGGPMKINDIKKQKINKVVNSNNVGKNNVNPILVNKSKNLVNSKIKIKNIPNIKNTGNNTMKNKRTKILKPKPQNINIKISPNHLSSKSYSNVFKKQALTNNTNNNTQILINPGNKLAPKKVRNPNIKKVNLKMNNLSINLNNNAEGKINKVKTMHIHCNIKKENNNNIIHKKLNTDIIFKNNNNEKINSNLKRINKYKNLRHKINNKSGDLPLQKKEINNNSKLIPKSHVFHKTINSTINNSNNTISNTIHSNNNNNTIISIYNNYNINKNSSRNGIYKDIPEINFDLDSLNNNNNKSNNMNKYLSFNGYKLNNYKNYIHINQRKSPIVTNKKKNISNINNYPSLTPHYNNSQNILENLINAKEYSYHENYQNNNLKNYFSLNENNNIPNNFHKKNKVMNLSSARQNMNSLKIKKILTEMKYNDSNEKLLNKNKKENIIGAHNNINHFMNYRSNSFIIGKKGAHKNFNFYPTINRKKTEIFYQKLPEFKMNFDIGNPDLIQDDRNNTPSFKRYDPNRAYFNNYLNENEYLSLKF